MMYKSTLRILDCIIAIYVNEFHHFILYVKGNKYVIILYYKNKLRKRLTKKRLYFNAI